MFSSLDVLQFPDFIALVARYCGSAAGRERISNLEPVRDADFLNAELAEVAEAITYAREASNGSVPRIGFGELPDVAASLRILRVSGASLDGPQILQLFSLLRAAGEVRAALLKCAEEFVLLAARARRLADLRPAIRQYDSAFTPEGALTDDASPALGRIRRDMARQRRSIAESLQRFLHAHRGGGTLQEDLITVRDDRYVVPVVAGQKGRVDGIIHGSSGTGRTVFIEPLETVGLNNELVRLREDELTEIARILAEITDALREHREEIASCAETLAVLDAVFAKASFARDYDCTIPKFAAQERRLVLKAARHPLLQSILRKQKKRVIPISLELDENRRCLLISGPNTGGKTVTMKTVGLLTLMAHAALPVPAEEMITPLLDDVLADIGDQQSIAESLSSFSGHLLHVKSMLENVTSDSLVLLDELGRATDPEEGGALGVAILDEFRKSGAFCLASTHLLPMKLYGTKTPNVVNASMGFDQATLQPTYELRIGLPGKSAGLDIATRLEMPEEILRHAREVLPRLQADFEALLSDLDTQVREHRRAAQELDEERVRLEKRRVDLEQQAVRTEQKRQREWASKQEELIADFEARAQMTMAEVAEKVEDRKALEVAQRQIGKTRREFREQAETVMAPTIAAAKLPEQQLVIAEGARVKLRDVRETATVRRILRNGMYEVEAGFLRMQVPREDIVAVVDAKDQPDRLKNIRVETGPTWNTSYRELNLIGQRADEAADQLDKFLDSAALASVNRLRIVHGHGMGVLKKAVGDLLSKNPHVSKFYPAPSSEGGTGATIVELRD